MHLKNDTKILVDVATEARNFSQAAFSGFRVGAAIETEDGKIFSGCNVESSSYGLTICAERVALTKALSEGYTRFTAIAVVGPINDYCPPCGACRQLLHDYAPELKIVLSNGKEIREHSLKELLPFAFEKTNLRKK